VEVEGIAMTHSIHWTHRDRQVDAATWVRRAWWSLLLFVVSFVAAVVVGEGLAAAYGYPSGDEDVPAWVLLGAGLPACAVFALPVLVTWLFARRAARAGDAGGRGPLLVAAGIVGLFLAQNLLGLVATLVT
jgi:hypothetical protein